MLVRWLQAQRMVGAAQQQRTDCRCSLLFSFTRERLVRQWLSTPAISFHNCRLSSLASSQQNCSFWAKLHSMRNLLNSFSKKHMSCVRDSTLSSLSSSSQARFCLLRRATENQKTRYLRQRDSLQSERSAEVRFLRVGWMLRSLKLHFLMQSTPLMMYPIRLTISLFYSSNCYRICSLSATSCLRYAYSLFSYASVSILSSDLSCMPQLLCFSVVTNSGSWLFFLKRITDQYALTSCSDQMRYAADFFSSGSSLVLIERKGQVFARNSFSSAKETRERTLRSIMRYRNLRKFSSRSEDEPIIFIRWESGFCFASSRAARYSLQLAVFFFRQGWKPNTTQYMQVPSEYMSLFQLGRNRRDLSFSGGMQEMVPLRVVVSLHSTPTSDTPKSHSLKVLPLRRMLAGLMSSWTMPTSSSVTSPLATWKNRSQISSSPRGVSPRWRRQLMSVPDSQYSWKMQRLLPDSRCSLWVLTRLGQSGRLWMMRSSFRYSCLTSSDQRRMTLTANAFWGSLTETALQTLAQRPSPRGWAMRRYLSCTPVSSLWRVTTFALSYIV